MPHRKFSVGQNCLQPFALDLCGDSRHFFAALFCVTQGKITMKRRKRPCRRHGEIRKHTVSKGKFPPQLHEILENTHKYFLRFSFCRDGNFLFRNCFAPEKSRFCLETRRGSEGILDMSGELSGRGFRAKDSFSGVWFLVSPCLLAMFSYEDEAYAHGAVLITYFSAARFR